MTAGFKGGRRWKRAVAGAAMAPAIVAALLAHGPAARAQQDYQLPSATPTPTPPPRAAGPVAEGAPPPTPVASPTGTPPVIVLPTPRATPRPAASPSPATDRRAPPEARAPEPRSATPSPTPSLTPSPAASATPEPLPEAAASAVPEPETAPSGAPVASTPDTGGWLWWIGGGALALAVLALAAWARRRRPAARDEPAEVQEAEPESAPSVAAMPVPRPAPTPLPPPPAPAPSPVAPAAARGLVLTLEAVRLGATLVNTTLAYRLTATNAGPDALSDIAISGDMIAAHASRSMEEQLGIAGPELPPIGRIERLGPGESAVLEGEFRLPLAAVTPIRHGQAQLFVPVARFDAWASDSAHRAVSARAAFLVGQDNATASDRLQPFRLDLGPRVWDAIGQRALEIPETL